MPNVHKILINYDYDEDNHNALNVWQDKLIKNSDIIKEVFLNM